MPAPVSNPVRIFIRSTTCRTAHGRGLCSFNRGDQATNIKRIGGRVQFDAGENTTKSDRFEMDWITFVLATELKPAPEQKVE